MAEKMDFGNKNQSNMILLRSIETGHYICGKGDISCEHSFNNCPKSLPQLDRRLSSERCNSCILSSYSFDRPQRTIGNPEAARCLSALGDTFT